MGIGFSRLHKPNQLLGGWWVPSHRGMVGRRYPSWHRWGLRLTPMFWLTPLRSLIFSQTEIHPWHTMIEQGTIPAPSQPARGTGAKSQDSQHHQREGGKGKPGCRGAWSPSLRWLTPWVNHLSMVKSLRNHLFGSRGGTAGCGIDIAKGMAGQRGGEPGALSASQWIWRLSVKVSASLKTKLKLGWKKKKTPGVIPKVNLNISRFAQPCGFGVRCSCSTQRAFQSALQASVPK